MSAEIADIEQEENDEKEKNVKYLKLGVKKMGLMLHI